MSVSTEIRGTYDTRDVKVLLSALDPKQWAFAEAMTLTRTGGRVKDAETAEMRAKLDRPKPFTLNSLRLERATKAKLQARVWFKDRDYGAQKGTPAGDYLMPQVHGGPRKNKRFERALQHKGMLRSGKQLVPAAGAPRDAYGNVPKGLYMRILSQVRAHQDPSQNETTRSRRRNRNKFSGRYFYGNPHGRGAGVWERMRGGQVLGGRMRGGIVPIFREATPHNYRKRFAFLEVAERTTEKHIGPEFVRSAEDVLRTARR